MPALRCSPSLLTLALCLCCRGLPAADSYTFRLHKFEQPIGTETVKAIRLGPARMIHSTFEFTDRGTKVPLKGRLLCSGDYTPRSFEIDGSTSRLSQAHVFVHVYPKGAARIDDGSQSRTQMAPKRFFTVAGYAPAAMQEALLLYWQHHGRPSRLPILPAGSVEITDRGHDTIPIGTRSLHLRRYSVSGLVWGLETVWMDSHNHLAAVITRDAEFDHFEAIREPYEPALAQFISLAARDETGHLSELTSHFANSPFSELAITGATLIDGTDRPPVCPATVLIANGKILAAGPAAQVAIPNGARRIDATGKFVIPGLWDMHAHYEQVEWGPIYLAAGVTTVRDVGNEFGFITAVRDANNAGRGIGPRLLLAGVVDGDGPMSLGTQRVNSAADAAFWVKKYHDAGFGQMKIYSSVKPPLVKVICEDAHALGMSVTGHIPIGMTILDGVRSGMDQINHITYVTQAFAPPDFHERGAKPADWIAMLKGMDLHSPQATRVIEELHRRGTVLDDTAAVFELDTRGPKDPATFAEPGIDDVAPELRPQLEGNVAPPERVEMVKLRWQKTLEIMRVLHQAGIPFVAGTDQAVPGFSVYRELELYVQAGWTPLEALQSATAIPARAMKVEADSGTVEAGKRADLDILDRNPLVDIHNIRSVHAVIAHGVLYDPKPLWQSVGFRAPQ